MVTYHKLLACLAFHFVIELNLSEQLKEAMPFKENSLQCFQILVLSYRQRVEIFYVACQCMIACPAG